MKQDFNETVENLVRIMLTSARDHNIDPVKAGLLMPLGTVYDDDFGLENEHLYQIQIRLEPKAKHFIPEEEIRESGVIGYVNSN